MQTLATYNNSAAPGTLKNRARQAKLYIQFCVTFGVNYLHPSPIQAAMYAQLLANSHTSPSTLKNYISGAKFWVTHPVGNPSAFLSPPVQDVIKRLCSNSLHVPSQALPI